MIFKGGTCLRKCYFPNYRFSEDLDFTSINPNFELNETLLLEIISLIEQRTGMQLHLDKLTKLQHDNELTGFAANIKFWGSDHSKSQNPPAPQRWTTSIKIEIIFYETIAFEPSTRSIFHDYSDKLSSNAEAIACYDIREVLSEKLRALIQRSYTAPRDYYDIWYLYKYGDVIDWSDIKSAFIKKMEFKGLEFTGVNQLLNEKGDNSVRRAWTNSLGHQIPEGKLPDFNQVRADLEKLLNEIF